MQMNFLIMRNFRHDHEMAKAFSFVLYKTCMAQQLAKQFLKLKLWKMCLYLESSTVTPVYNIGNVKKEDNVFKFPEI